jgi:hypothetical protein
MRRLCRTLQKSTVLRKPPVIRYSKYLEGKGWLFVTNNVMVFDSYAPGDIPFTVRQCTKTKTYSGSYTTGKPFSCEENHKMTSEMAFKLWPLGKTPKEYKTALYITFPGFRRLIP